MELLNLLDELEEVIVQARRLPMGGNLVLDRKRILDVVDQIRLAVPDDLREAHEVLSTRDRIVGEAAKEAQRILEEAEVERDRMLDEHAITTEARRQATEETEAATERAHEIVDEADHLAAAHLSEAAEAVRKQLAEADTYAMEVLQRLENQLQSFLDSIRDGIAGLEEKR